MTDSRTDSLDQLLFAHSGYLRRLASGLVRAERADDLVQQTLVTALERPPQQAAAVRGWLAAVARRAAGRWRRGDARRAAREARVGEAGRVQAATVDVVGQQELVVFVAEAVAALPEPYRTTIHLHYYEDLPPRAIAVRMAAGEAAVKTRLRRARELLRASLERRAPRGAWRAGLALVAGVPQPSPAVAATAAMLAGKWLLALGVAALAVVPFLPGGCQVAPASGAAARVTATARPTSAPSADEVVREAIPEVQPAVPTGVAGRVVAGDGMGQEGVRLMVWVGPHPSGDPNQWTRTESLASARDGAFAVAVAAGTEVGVTVDDPHWRHAEPVMPRFVAPATAALVAVQAVPTARLVVRARDLATGEPLTAFRCAIHVPADGSGWPEAGQPYAGSSAGGATTTGVLQQDVALGDAQSAWRVQVDLLGETAASERRSLRAGDVAEIELACRRGAQLAGIVTDAMGLPIVDALVVAGSQRRARGDEPGKPFRGERLGDGVRTDARGAFTLATTATHVTAWHPDYSPRTVAAAEAHAIVLPAFGSLRGRLLDARGQPCADTEVRLDRSRAARTDAAGGFGFAAVEAGARVLYVPGDAPTQLAGAVGSPWIVQVAAGEACDVTLLAGLPEVQMTLVDHGGAKVAALVGRGQATSLVFGELVDDRVTCRGVVPGDYLLLTDQGALVPCTIAGPTATVACRDPEAHSELVVAAAAPGAFHLVPADADDLVRVLVARLVRRPADARGVVRFGPLREGRYELCRGDEPVGRAVGVFGDTTHLRGD